MSKRVPESMRVLFNIRSLRAVSRDLTLPQLEDMLDKLTLVVEECREEDSKMRASYIERQNKILALAQSLTEQGVNVAVLMQALSIEKEEYFKKKRVRTAKYEYTNHAGERKTWTGQGRAPTTIQEALDSGKPLSAFLIKEDDN